MNHFTYTSRHFTPHGNTWTQLIDLAPNVWLHSSVGRASHRYRGGHGFESRWSPDFFQASLSNCLSWKIYCDDHSLLSSTTAVQIWIISYILHVIKKVVAKKKLEGEDTSWHITWMANAPNGSFSIRHFATVREREERDCLVAITTYFNIMKLLRPSDQIFSVYIHFQLCIWLSEQQGEKRKTGNAATCTID